MKITRTVAAIVAAAAVGVTIAGSTGANPLQPAEEIVFRSERAGQPDLYLIGRDGSSFRRLTFSEARERTPRISPDGKWIAFASNAAGSYDIWVVRRDGSELTRVTTHPEFEDSPVWLPDGRIVFLRGPFACQGACATAAGVNRGGGREATIPIGSIQSGGIDVSADGTRIVYGRDGSLYRAALDGTGETQVTTPTEGVFDFRPSVSPDGERIAFIRSPDDANNELAVANADGTGLNVLTATPGRHEEYASWSMDGQTILFMTFGNEDGRLRQINPDGTGEAVVSTDIKAPFLHAFSNDGRDASVWHEAVSGTGVSLEQANGRLELAFSADATEGGQYNQIAGSYGSRCQLPGDFDMQVEYELLEWPEANGTGAALQAFFANTTAIRESQVWQEQYGGWLDGHFGTAWTNQTAGTMRLVRSGSQAAAYYRFEGIWVPIRIGPANATPVTFGVALMSFGGNFAHQAVRVAFDNFRLNSGAVECPEWWRNAAFGDFG